MRAGDLVRFKMNDYQTEWSLGLLLRYDKVIKVAEISDFSGNIHYAPARLVQTHQRGKRK